MIFLVMYDMICISVAIGITEHVASRSFIHLYHTCTVPLVVVQACADVVVRVCRR